MKRQKAFSLLVIFITIFLFSWIFITSYYHGEDKGFATDIHNIFVDSVSFKSASHAGIVIQGYPDKKVNNVHFNKLRIDACATAVSLTNTENIVFNDVVIG